MAKCYVGTYGKYNAGSIYGKWLDLNDYATYADFIAACKELHKNERDPRTRDCIHRLTENDCKKALAILKDERAKFEKRFQTYLKRYGISKLHTWTYWADR